MFVLHCSVLYDFISFWLQSKRVGHFFFWYTRSEVAGCPYFRQRMAVILEAYLLGCGQAMLDSFIQQVKAVEVLHKVAKTTKSLFPDKTDLPISGETQFAISIVLLLLLKLELVSKVWLFTCVQDWQISIIFIWPTEESSKKMVSIYTN